MGEYIDLAGAAMRAQDLKRQGRQVKGFSVTQTAYDSYKSRNQEFDGEIAVTYQSSRDVFYVLPLSKEQAQRFGLRSNTQVSYSHLTLEELRKAIE